MRVFLVPCSLLLACQLEVLVDPRALEDLGDVGALPDASARPADLAAPPDAASAPVPVSFAECRLTNVTEQPNFQTAQVHFDVTAKAYPYLISFKLLERCRKARLASRDTNIFYSATVRCSLSSETRDRLKGGLLVVPELGESAQLHNWTSQSGVLIMSRGSVGFGAPLDAALVASDEGLALSLVHRQRRAASAVRVADLSTNGVSFNLAFSCLNPVANTDALPADVVWQVTDMKLWPVGP